MKYVVFIYTLLFIVQSAFAGLPPTKIITQSGATNSVNFNFAVPYNQATKYNTGYLIETGNQNWLTNPGFENTVQVDNQWGGGGNTRAIASARVEGKQALDLNMDGTNGNVLVQSYTPSSGQTLSGVNIEASGWFNTTVSGMQLCIYVNVVSQNCVSIQNDGLWHQASVYGVGSASLAVAWYLNNTSLLTGHVLVDAAYLGPSRNIGSAAATPVAFNNVSGAATSQTTGTPVQMTFGTSSIDNYAGVSGNQWTVPLTGKYEVGFTIQTGAATGTKSALIKVNGTQAGVSIAAANAGASSLISGSQQLALNKGDVVTLWGSNASGTTENWTLNSLSIASIALDSQIVVRQNMNILPTVQKFTASGTYTTPVGVTHIRVRMVGGGGGGSGAGTAASYGTAGGSGGQSAFGSSLLTAGGGTGGAVAGGNGGAGGSGSCGTISSCLALAGGSGGASSQTPSASAQYVGGGSGGVNPFGGAGGGGSVGSAGLAAAANTGAGGGGGGTSGATSSAVSGTGGGAGAYVEAIITNPASSYPVTIGAAGSAGGAGTGGLGGGPGAPGYVEVTEFYGTNTPMVVGSVNSGTSGMERLERMTISNSGTACTIATQSGVAFSSPTRNGTGRCSITMTGFSGTPSCVCTARASGGIPGCGTDGAITQSSTSWGFTTSFNGTATDTTFDVICMGPR